MIRLGDIELTIVSGGRFKLDGGAMFGIIPKPLWERVTVPDERNRIPLATNCVLVRAGGRTALIDTGLGAKWGERERDIFGIEGGTIVDALAAVGVTPEQVDMVIYSHLHLDHAGGGTEWADGLVHPRQADSLPHARPTFPRARYVAQRGEWEDAVANRSTMKVTYRSENLLPLQEAGLLDVVEGDVELLPGVRTLVTGGHTRFHQAITFASGGQRAIYLGDIVPTTRHLRPAYNMAYDLDPYQTMQRKLELLDRACDEGWLAIWDHDPDHALRRVVRGQRGEFSAASAINE
jgi:glyoxylase-like metal-dependent hydrolase (beta-lactamase superfamily II)